ncbi:hypothetical protein F4821DRAFT_264593 [Hypoxylon rubiginosum]|uniref:Uncharacterized protein n=1 Tax=Hypoxylon rubiginosum TaxID=110542 RepID=A0ACC0CN61_9PEZI|nr:hypothetical protein F4821DRAFT_264593 [Hypoxylon rubiginosum]
MSGQENPEDVPLPPSTEGSIVNSQHDPTEESAQNTPIRETIYVAQTEEEGKFNLTNLPFQRYHDWDWYELTHIFSHSDYTISERSSYHGPYPPIGLLPEGYQDEAISGYSVQQEFSESNDELRSEDLVDLQLQSSIPSSPVTTVQQLPPINSVLQLIDSMAPAETRSQTARGPGDTGEPSGVQEAVPTVERPSTTPPREQRATTLGDDGNNDPKGKQPERFISLPPPEGMAYMALP